ncbi:ECF transporter S component [Ruminiclostridium cellobioparum]|uniref:ECF transporter S component n=1 Tax=Ruminiclostridium cellobioparum TaxID=29355 RepID=UPI0004854201|nr:ECF transporter S component [Ruminiclostridium cellobioparum]
MNQVNNRNNIRMITRTAVLLAVVVVVQIVGRSLPNNNFIVGPLVNMCLLLAAMTAGMAGGITIAILSPFTSLINNNAPIAAALLPFAPVIALANIIFVLAFYLLYNKNKFIGLGVGAVLKFGVLFLGIRIFLNIFSFPKFTQKLFELFSWPQLLTAVIGGLVAIPVIYSVRKALKIR